MFYILYFIIHAIRPFLVPLCFVSAWLLIILGCWSIWRAIADSIANAKRMHSIPCSNCQYFTNDYRLKCTVKPHIALSEDAINCSDFTEATTESRLRL